jgi:hypothetical protein
MADEVTAATKAAGFDRSGGFGATEQKSENADRIRELLDEAQSLMIEDGMDPATAEALTNHARPASIVYSGNLADLNRMGQVALQGKIDTPPGQEDVPASDLGEAFAQPPQPDLNTGLQTPMGQTDDSGKAEAGGTGSDMTKDEIKAELDDRGIEYTSSMTKAELQALL